MTISCEVNGRTVAQRTEKVPPLAHSYEEALLLTPAPISPTATAEAENMKSLSIGTTHKLRTQILGLLFPIPLLAFGKGEHPLITSTNFSGFWTPPLSIPNPRNLPSFSQNLANPLPPLPLR